MMSNESNIIKRLQKGDTEALRSLMELHQDYVFTIAYRIVKNREKAEEVTQDVFVKVYQNINAYQSRSKFTTWQYTIVYRTALNASNKKDAAHYTDDFDINNIEYFQTINLESNPDFDSVAILERAIDQLSIMQGLCISLFYLNQFNIDEISTILKIPANTVKTHLHRGRKKLRAILLEQYRKEEIL